MNSQPAADHRLRLVAVDRAAGRGDVLDALVGRQASDDVRGVLGQQAEPRLVLAQRIAQLTLGGDVLGDGRDPRHPPVLDAHRLGARPDPPRLAVRPHDAAFEVGRLRRGIPRRQHGVAIVRMDELLERERILVQRREVDAEDPPDRRADIEHLRRIELAQQEALLDRLGDLAEAVLALAQLGLQAQALADVMDVADEQGSPSTSTCEIDVSTVRVSPLRVVISASRLRTTPSAASCSRIAVRSSRRPHEPTSTIDRPTNSSSGHPSSSRQAGLANRITPSATRVTAVGICEASRIASICAGHRGPRRGVAVHAVEAAARVVEGRHPRAA